MSEHVKSMYEHLGELFLSRGLELGKGRALTAEEATSDPVVAPYLEHLIDAVLGEGEAPS